MELTDSLKTLFIEIVNRLKGHARRVLWRTVRELGHGS